MFINNILESIMPEYRIEHDSLGEVRVPLNAYWGAQAQRAVDNFPVSGHKASPGYIWASGAIKLAAAQVHLELGLLEKSKADAIMRAAREVTDMKLNGHFVVDVYQAGAGTSHNMNTNEVIANRALEILGYERGKYDIIHPNDHVNMSQSTNDFIPTALRLFFMRESIELLDILSQVEEGFRNKAIEFADVLKSARTHLQDAVPIKISQEFNGYAEAIKRSRDNIKQQRDQLAKIGLGGSAAGTGLNVHPKYRRLVTEVLGKISGFEIRMADDYFWAMQSLGPLVDFSSSLNNLAIEISRIMNDLRLLASGPTTGLSEIILPPVQPGSSIMPGKVNPVLAEMMNMVCFSVIGYHHSIEWAAGAGQLELNVMMPLFAYSGGEALKAMTGGLKAFKRKALDGLSVNREKCQRFLENSFGLVTVLNPIIGYEKAAEVAKEAVNTGKSLREIIISKGYLTLEQMENVLNPQKLTEPGIPSIE